MGAIPHRAPGAVINNLKVLIVDDEADILRVISRVLRRAGLTVVTARSGEEALEVLSSQSDFDCLLSDIMMPGISGIELVQRIPAALQKRAILVTASVPEDIDYAAIPDGIPVLRKPVDMQDLREAIQASSERGLA